MNCIPMVPSRAHLSFGVFFSPVNGSVFISTLNPRHNISPVPLAARPVKSIRLCSSPAKLQSARFKNSDYSSLRRPSSVRNQERASTSTIALCLSSPPHHTRRRTSTATAFPYSTRQISRTDLRMASTSIPPLPSRATASMTLNNDLPKKRANETDRKAMGEVAADVQPPDYLSDAELSIFNTLRREFDPTKLEVQDISGGCGSMYALSITSARFKGLSMVKQHRLVNEVLKKEISGWHGVQLRTNAV